MNLQGFAVTEQKESETEIADIGSRKEGCSRACLSHQRGKYSNPFGERTRVAHLERR